jgi:Spy/CpxP family protein refolding chaperone
MMNRSRKFLLGGVAALAMAGAIAVSAQGPGGPGHHGPWGKDHNPTDMLATRLGLTDTQKAQVQPILDAAKPQLKAIHDEARAKSKAVMDDVTTKITPFLTPEQQEDLRSMQRQMKRMHDQAAGAKTGS